MLFTSSLLENTDVLDVLALRFLMSAVVFTLLALCKVVRVDYKGKNIKNIMLAAFFEPVLYFIFENFGIHSTNTSTAGLILATAPAFTMMFEKVFLHETTTWPQKMMIFLRIFAAMLIVFNSASSGENTLQGIICIIIAGVSGSLFAIFSRKSAQDFTAVEVTYLTTMVGMVVFNAINMTRHLLMGTIATYFVPYFNTRNLIGFVFLSVVSSIFATMMGNYVFGKIQPSIASAFSGVSTIVTVLLGALVNNETIYKYHYVSILLITAACTGIVVLDNNRKCH